MYMYLYTHLYFNIPLLKTALLFPEFICTLLMIIYSGNYAGILDASLNEGYSSASFKLVVVSAVMSRQLTLFGKALLVRKCMANQQTTVKKLSMLLLLMNIAVLPRCCYSKQRS